jgi:cysteine-rich repeat protein
VFSSGEPKIDMGGQCYLSKPVLNTKTGATVIQMGASCDVLKEAGLAQHTSAACTLCQQACTAGKGYCGDGQLQAGEECDDGNTKFLDGCTPKCKKTKCFMGCIGKKLDPWAKFLAGVYEYASSKVKDTGLVGSWKLYAQDPACKIPEAITDASGKVLLPAGAPCLDYNKLYTFKLDASATLECKKQCSTQPAEYQGCVTTCKNIPECKETKVLYDKITQDGCVLSYGVKKGDDYLCPVNAPCSCALPYVSDKCVTISSACKEDCISKYGSQPPEGFDCKVWSETAPVYMETLGYSEAEMALKEGTLKQFKGDGAVLFEKIWPQIAAWNDFYTSTVHSPEIVKQAGDLALTVLKDAGPCGSINPAQYADATATKGICWNTAINLLSPADIQKTAADRAAKIALAVLWAMDEDPSWKVSDFSDGKPIGEYGYALDSFDRFLQKVIKLLVPEFDMTSKPGSDKVTLCNQYLSED